MFVTLTLFSTISTMELWRDSVDDKKAGDDLAPCCYPKIYCLQAPKYIATLGLMMLSLTGVFPDVNNYSDANYEYYAETSFSNTSHFLHMTGLSGIVLALFSSLYAGMATSSFHEWIKCVTCGNPCPQNSGHWFRSIHMAVIIIYLGCFVYTDNKTAENDPSNYCAFETSNHTCDTWPLHDLTIKNCKNVRKDKIVPKYSCSWVDGGEFLSTGYCVKDKCEDLFGRVMTIALEYGVLCLSMTYITSFGIHDIRIFESSHAAQSSAVPTVNYVQSRAVVNAVVEMSNEGSNE